MFEIVAILLALTATFAWLNCVTLRLPNTISLLIMGLLSSLILVGSELFFPTVGLFRDLSTTIHEIDFSEALLNGMLGFLLFAGALHVDLVRLKDRRIIIGVMATFGVFASTALVAVGFWSASIWLGTPIPFVWALIFGALISPTDPVAVLNILQTAKVRGSLEMDLAGESLFNDGVGVVLFAILLAAATHSGADSNGEFDTLRLVELFVFEALGGAVLGLATGYVAYHAMRVIDDYPIEVLISLALVTVTYATATQLHISGPIAVVVAGVLIGNRGAKFAMSDTTQQHLFGFWTLVDEILNSVLFLLIGLEVLVLQFDASLLPLAVLAIPIVLISRFFAVSGPVIVLSALGKHFERGTIPLLTWAGIRGGISVALALSISAVDHKSALLLATYMVAIFTIVVQGLSLKRVAEWLGSAAAEKGVR